MPLPVGDFEALGQEEGEKDGVLVPHRVGLLEGELVGVTLLHCVTEPEPLKLGLGEGFPEVLPLGDCDTLGQEEGEKEPEEDPQCVGLTEGLPEREGEVVSLKVPLVVKDRVGEGDTLGLPDGLPEVEEEPESASKRRLGACLRPPPSPASESPCLILPSTTSPVVRGRIPRGYTPSGLDANDAGADGDSVDVTPPWRESNLEGWERGKPRKTHAEINIIEKTRRHVPSKGRGAITGS